MYATGGPDPDPPSPRSAAGETTGVGAGSSAPSTAQGPIPGYLLIADRGNNRLLLVDGRKRILWRYPGAGKPPSFPFTYDDDAFCAPGWRSIITNEEDQQTIELLSFPGGRVQWHYGHPGSPGSAAGFLNTPDDAYLLADGTRTVADIGNCRVLFLSPAGHVTRQLGTTGVCQHDPPGYLAGPNGDTPTPDGGMLVTEITGSWIDKFTANGKLAWSVQAPVGYPSDAQPLAGGRILLADYSSPGHVLILDRKGNVLWRYGPASGGAALDHPSLALMLPGGLIAVNDDYRHRVVLIDRRRERIVWQYGRTDVAGSGPGLLDVPDGIDFLPARVAARVPAIHRLVSSTP